MLSRPTSADLAMALQAMVNHFRPDVEGIDYGAGFDHKLHAFDNAEWLLGWWRTGSKPTADRPTLPVENQEGNAR